jgi:alpha-L-rhamnosidase
VVIEIQTRDGQKLLVISDDAWKSENTEQAGWMEPAFDDSAWPQALVAGPYGIPPWNEVSLAQGHVLPARMLRKEFDAGDAITRATAYICGLGMFELYLNGDKIGDQVLAPALSEYDKRVYYMTFDVTSSLRGGTNAVGVWLGNGRYFAPRLLHTRHYGFPKLLFQLEIERQNGQIDRIVSDETWTLTTEGPIRANNEFDGEIYDARLESPGWDAPGFDDAHWAAAQAVDAPGGVVAAQTIEPIRVTGSIRPIAMSEPKPGVYIYDMGQNMVGWCRLRVAGPAGTPVRLRHAEVLDDDGTLYLANLRSAKVTDLYILNGTGEEIYEPRFTFHGFRYVELTGYPGQPSLDTIEGFVLNDDVASAGTFACSNPLLNQIYANILWGVRGNYRSIPTDCPQRDERQGWLGDRSEESRGETYLYQIGPLYAKWVQDMHDAQRDTGSVPDVAPSYYPFYTDNVTWPSSFIIVPGALYDQYGDRRVIERHYDGMKLWITYMTQFIQDGIMPRDKYGDWCVPPEDPTLIHSKDPKRQTAGEVLGTAYFYHDLQLMARYAGLLAKPDDAGEFRALATTLRDAFIGKFYNSDSHDFSNGSQTASILPLAFGLVPEGAEQAVFDALVEKIVVGTDSHVGTGLIGGQWLMRTLSNGGRPDLAYTLATQTTYPSWGYMIENGATTMWELWNGNTADPAMNSHNHVMLVGDLALWFHEFLGGIRPNREHPGFKHFTLRPVPIEGLDHVSASHESLYGTIRSDWTRRDGQFDWKFTIPANTTATVYVPTPDPASVRESGTPIEPSEVAREHGSTYAVYELGSGNYQLTARDAGG